jgi:biopolymer transport protein ExbB
MVRFGRRAAICLALAWFATAARAQEPPAEEPARAAARPPAPAPAGAPSIGRESLLRLFQQANPMMWPLAACSVVMIGYALERWLALRRGRVLPREFGQRFVDRVAQGKLDRDRALELCRANDSPLARVLAATVRHWGQPAATIGQAVDHDAASEYLDLRRNVRVLNATATIAPLLGLLGTVVGMVESFDAVGGGRAAGASRSEALAHGISLALLATAVGLAIAVVSVAFYYYFLQRIDTLTRELDERSRQVIDLISAEALRAARVAAAGPEPAPPVEAPARPHRPSLGRVDTA